MGDGRVREFDNGRIKVKFHTEQDAKDFDAYLESEWTLTIGGEEIDRWIVKDRFDPYSFFNIERSDEDE